MRSRSQMYCRLIRTGFRFRSHLVWEGVRFNRHRSHWHRPRNFLGSIRRARAEWKVSRSRKLRFPSFSRDLLLSWRDTVIVGLMPDKSEVRKTRTVESTRLAYNLPLRTTRTCPLRFCFIVSAFTVVKVNFAQNLRSVYERNMCCKRLESHFHI